MPDTAIAVIDGKPVTLEVLLERSKAEIAKALPIQIPVERLIRTAITTVRKSEKLQNCNALSILGCVMEGASIGLEIGTALGNAYMVPYATEAQFQIGYRGLMTLAYRSPRVAWCDGTVVYKGDEFDYRKGTDPYINHVPCGESDFEKVTHAYFIVKLTDGTVIFNVWPVKKILAHRDKYSRAYQKNEANNPWTLAPEPMYIKTVARPTLKMAPISAELQRAISLDEQAEVGIPQQLAKDLAEDITGGEETKKKEEFDPETIVHEYNRDEYPDKGKHSENGKEPKTYRNIPQSYINWGCSPKLGPCEMKTRLIAENQSRKLDEAANEGLADAKCGMTDAEFENGGIPSGIAKLLEHPVLSEEEAQEWRLLIESEDNPPEEWLARQEAIIRGIIADKEREGDKQGTLL